MLSLARTAEYSYRMQRMRYLYPDMMTAETLYTLDAALSTGSIVEFRRAATIRTTEVTRIVSDIRYVCM
jgi:hypothetical protein